MTYEMTGIELPPEKSGSKINNFQLDWERLSRKECAEIAAAIPKPAQFRTLGQWVDACQEQFPLLTLSNLLIVKEFMVHSMMPKRNKPHYTGVFLGIKRSNDQKTEKIHFPLWANSLPSNELALKMFLASSDSKPYKNVCVITIWTNFY